MVAQPANPITLPNQHGGHRNQLTTWTEASKPAFSTSLINLYSGSLTNSSVLKTFILTIYQDLFVGRNNTEQGGWGTFQLRPYQPDNTSSRFSNATTISSQSLSPTLHICSSDSIHIGAFLRSFTGHEWHFNRTTA
jgi:hypothetical protein